MSWKKSSQLYGLNYSYLLLMICTVVWFQEILPNIEYLYTIIWFQVTI